MTETSISLSIPEHDTTKIEENIQSRITIALIIFDKMNIQVFKGKEFGELLNLLKLDY